MNLGFVDGIYHPIPATVYVKKLTEKPISEVKGSESLSDSLYGWCYAAVPDYDSVKNLWKVFTLDGSRRTFWLPRIFVRFIAEDPRVFVQRIKFAINNRNQAEACIR